MLISQSLPLTNKINYLTVYECSTCKCLLLVAGGFVPVGVAVEFILTDGTVVVILVTVEELYRTRGHTTSGTGITWFH